MFEKPRVIMSAADLPLQRLHSVVELPERPRGFRAYVDWRRPMPARDRPQASPRKVEFLGSVEWAWGPNHERWDAYYLNPRGRYWLLWIYSPDPNAWVETWRWTLYAWALKKGASASQAASYLLLDAWSAEARGSGLGGFDWINEPGQLSVPELCAVARRAWPETEFVDEEVFNDE
jgi:hypothetical protein